MRLYLEMSIILHTNLNHCKILIIVNTKIVLIIEGQSLAHILKHQNLVLLGFSLVWISVSKSLVL